MAGNDKSVILVLGMHRSGTSALTGMLNCFGADVPLEDNTRIGRDNPKGHWEHNQIMRFNDQILRHYGHTWTTWGAMDLDRVSEGLFQRIKSFMQTAIENAQSDIVVFKDPRFCVVLPLWIKVLEQLGHQPKFIFSMRSPDAVARSIDKRNTLDYERGLLLWLHYNLTVLQQIADHPCYRTRFPDWMQQTESIYRGASRQLGIDWPLAWEEAKDRTETFLDADLVHNNTNEVLPTDFLRDVCDQLFAITDSPTEDGKAFQTFLDQTSPWLEVCGQAIASERRIWRGKVTDMYNQMHRNI